MHTVTSLKDKMNVIDSTIFTIAKVGVIPNGYVPNVAHMNQVDSNGVTPLHVACWKLEWQPGYCESAFTARGCEKEGQFWSYTVPSHYHGTEGYPVSLVSFA